MREAAPLSKLPLFLTCTLLLAAASAYRGFLLLFTHFADYDDTGAMLSLITSFNERGSLYRETFCQYGPFFSEFYFFVARILHVPMTQDGIRLFVLALWITSAALGGVLAYRLTRNLWLALLAQALAFQMLYSLMAEPGHPISVVALLLGALAFCFSAELQPRSAILSGAIIALLLMTKINVGIFALASCGTGVVFCAPRDFTGRALRVVVALVFCALALRLVTPLWPNPARWTFLLFFFCTLLAPLVCDCGTTLPWQTLVRFGIWMAISFAIVCGAIVAIVLLGGTTIADLHRGLILQPMAFGDLFTIVPKLDRSHAFIALLSLGGACAWRFLVRARAWLSFALRLIFVGLFTFAVFRGIEPWLALPFLWVAILPQENGQPTRFAQLSLVLLAIGQILGVYPVAGAHTSIPFYMAALCVAPALSGLLTAAPGLTLSWKSALAGAALVLLTVAIAATWKEEVATYRLVYERFIPLRLPGSGLVRLHRTTVATLECLSENLRRSSPSFLSLPGMNSFYGWAERPSPNSSNPTMNFKLLPADEQRRMVALARTCRPFALILHQRLLFEFWIGGRFAATGPLMDFLHEECRPAGRVHGYDLMCLKNDPPPELTYCAILESPGQITVRLPERLSDAAAVSLLDFSQPHAEPERIAVPKRERQLTFATGRAAELTSANTLRFVVQVWDTAGREIADLPFVQLPGAP